MHRVVTPKEGIGIIVGFVGSNSLSATLLKGLGGGEQYEIITPSQPSPSREGANIAMEEVVW